MDSPVRTGGAIFFFCLVLMPTVYHVFDDSLKIQSDRQASVRRARIACGNASRYYSIYSGGWTVWNQRMPSYWLRGINDSSIIPQYNAFCSVNIHVLPTSGC